MEPDNPALDRYILQQSGAAWPNVCFIGTASGDSDRYLAGFYAAYSRLEARPSHLPLFSRTPELRSLLLDQQVIFVGGGNTKSMLAVWREWGLPEILQEAWQQGVLLAGVSAGAICWFEQGLTDSFAGSLRVLDGLGFLPGSFVPHYDSDQERRPAVHAALLRGEIQPALAVDDGAAVHFKGQAIYKVVTSRSQAGAYKVTVEGGEIVEKPLETTLI